MRILEFKEFKTLLLEDELTDAAAAPPAPDAAIPPPAPDAAKNAATEALEKELLEAAPTTPEA